MKKNVNTTSSPEIDWRAEYWKGVRDYIEQGDRLIKAQQRIVELTKELIECRDIFGRQAHNQSISVQNQQTELIP